MTVHTCVIGLLVAATFGLAGCDSSQPAKLAPVRGIVTYRGAPLPGGLIVFTPDDESGSHGASAQAVIGPDGRYTLNTDGTPGAMPGWHRVTVAGPPTSGWSLPDHFRDPVLSGLRAEVIAGRENVFDIPLTAR
jgi:hypothetical protein